MKTRSLKKKVKHKGKGKRTKDFSYFPEKNMKNLFGIAIIGGKEFLTEKTGKFIVNLIDKKIRNNNEKLKEDNNRTESIVD